MLVHVIKLRSTIANTLCNQQATRPAAQAHAAENERKQHKRTAWLIPFTVESRVVFFERQPYEPAKTLLRPQRYTKFQNEGRPI